MSQLLTDLALPTTITVHTIDLSPFGIHAQAWPRQAALALVHHLRGKPVAVLGGDVLRFENCQPVYTYDNWSIIPNQREEFAQYATRSHDETHIYLQHYKEGGPGYLYLLVLADHLPSLTPGMEPETDSGS